jgi:hypothetical protein
MYAMSDASYKMDERSVSGILILLGNKTTNVGILIYWKSKTVVHVCHSAKAAETQSIIKIMDDTQFFAIQLEQLLFGVYSLKIPIKIFTDSKPVLESIGSIHRVEEKMLRKGISDMKNKLYDGFMHSFSWLDRDRDMVADVLMKEVRVNKDLEDIVLKNKFRSCCSEDNTMMCHGGEIQIVNKCNKLA